MALLGVRGLIKVQITSQLTVKNETNSQQLDCTHTGPLTRVFFSICLSLSLWTGC